MVTEKEIEAEIKKIIEENSDDKLDKAIEKFAEDKTDEEIASAAKIFLDIYKDEDSDNISISTEKFYGGKWISEEEFLLKRNEKWFGLHYGYWDFPWHIHNGKHSSIRLCCLCGVWVDYLEKGPRTYKSILLPKSVVECPICKRIPDNLPIGGFQHGSYDCETCQKSFHTYESDFFCFTCLAEEEAIGHGKTWILDSENGTSMTVAKIKSILKKNGLSNKGKKAELVKRLNYFNKARI